MDAPHLYHVGSLNGGTTSPQVVTLNVGGRKFVTTRSTLNEGSTFFASLLSAEWQGGNLQKDGDLFLDANPEVFEYLLAFLRRSVPPVSWTRLEGFNLALYAAVQHEARFFGVSKLENWIQSKQYLTCVRVYTWIDFKAVRDITKPNGLLSLGDVEVILVPDQFESKGGEKRRQIIYRRTEIVTPVSKMFLSASSDRLKRYRTRFNSGRYVLGKTASQFKRGSFDEVSCTQCIF